MHFYIWPTIYKYCVSLQLVRCPFDFIYKDKVAFSVMQNGFKFYPYSVRQKMVYSDFELISRETLSKWNNIIV